MYKFLNTFAIGGLKDIGFARNSDNLVVLSSQGRGIFNCLTGEKIYRDGENWWPDYNQQDNFLKGFGPLTGTFIKLFGIHSGLKLTVETADNWFLTISDPQPGHPPFHHHKVHSIFLNHVTLQEPIFIDKDGPCEVVAFGFSETERSFVVALSCELTIWAKV